MSRILNFLEWIEAKITRPAKRKPLNPGSEQMVDSDVAKAQAESARNRRGSGQGRHPFGRRGF